MTFLPWLWLLTTMFTTTSSTSLSSRSKSEELSYLPPGVHTVQIWLYSWWIRRPTKVPARLVPLDYQKQLYFFLLCFNIGKQWFQIERMLVARLTVWVNSTVYVGGNSSITHKSHTPFDTSHEVFTAPFVWSIKLCHLFIFSASWVLVSLLRLVPYGCSEVSLHTIC